VVGVQVDQDLGDRLVEKAVARCAEAHFAGDSRRARQALLRGHCDHCACVSEGLVEQLAEYLGQVAGSVRGVYQVRVETEPAEGEAERRGELSAIHLVVWVERKSPALKALAGTLETVLAESRRKLGCPVAGPHCYALDVEMVDDRDVQEQRGFGLLVSHAHLEGRAVWTPAAGLPVVEEAPVASRLQYSLPETFDPEQMPEGRLIEHALTIERLAAEDRGPLEHHLTELKVTLIRRIISDQLEYIDIAKRWFRVADLADVFRHRIGFGRIGGKAAGMLLAGRILQATGGDDLKASITVPESFFLGSDLMYIFMAMNGLMHWNDQKYKPEDQIRGEYASIREQFQAGQFPPEFLESLRELLQTIGTRPLIVRSSSMLEDNFGTSFAGKYDSHFCPNQGGPEENLRALTQAIAGTYASTFKPDALLYRRSKRLQDYDERMAVLIQGVEGERFGRYYLPQGAGVAFSRNLYRWSPRIRREDGFARMVWGLGTRAVERVGNDFPRLVALSHPALQPDDNPEVIHSYSQHFVDVLDLDRNQLRTCPVEEVLASSYPSLRFLTQLLEDGSLVTPWARPTEAQLPEAVITFDGFLRRTSLASRLSQVLHLLEENYHSAVDLEFTFRIRDPSAAKPEADITLLQCRPQSHFQTAAVVRVPADLAPEDVVFSTSFMVPRGLLSDIRYVVFVSPEAYLALPSEAERKGIGRAISRLNEALPEKSFICVGPGRWGTTVTDLGISVGYSDICHAGALVELSGKGIGAGPEPSLGTHFFQDLMEAQIYPLALPLESVDTVFNPDFFYRSANSLSEFLTAASDSGDCLRLIKVESVRPGHHLELVMDDEKGQAVGFLAMDKVSQGDRAPAPSTLGS